MYKEYLPSPILLPYIDKYWEFEGESQPGMRINILPDGCTDFIFTLGEAFEAVNGGLLMQPYHSYFVGPMRKYSELFTHSRTVHMFGIRFLPCGVSCFMTLPLCELADRRLSVNDMDTFWDDSFAEQLYEKQHTRKRIDFVETILLKRLAGSNLAADTRIRYAVDYINRYKGQQPIRFLADEVCLCQRHFERIFKMYTGFSPKEYSRIIKFRHAVDLLRATSSDNLISIAVDAGYYDVSHLSKEIKNMSGSTAGSFLSIPQDDITLTYVER